LQRAVATLMRKTLAQLVADMRRLGATVVAADASSVILATGKRNLTAAVGCAWFLAPCS
jgi:DNA polymerase epsilon subunit 1